MTTKMKPICATCKSEHIHVDSYSTWNVALQQWQCGCNRDHYICADCGGERDVEWIPVRESVGDAPTRTPQHSGESVTSNTTRTH